MEINFYNTDGAYYNSSNSGSTADDFYYAAKNKKWRMKITAAQTALITNTVEKATVRMYNREQYNSTFTCYCVASKYASVGNAFAEGNYFGKTAYQSVVPYPTWKEFNFDVTTCFQYVYENWPGQDWYLWFYWTAGNSDTGFAGFNYSWRAPYFTITIRDNGPHDSNGPLDSYVWKTKNPTTYYYPEGPMTSDNSQDCVVTADSIYSGEYPAWRAFDKDNNLSDWCSLSTDDPHWIQIIYPKPLYNITVQIRNRTATVSWINGMKAGIIYGVGSDGTSLTELLRISGRDGGTGDVLTEHQLNNSDIAYSGIRIEATEIEHYNNDKYLAIGQILIKGEDAASNGQWVPADALIWKTTDAKTYTYPETAMSAYMSADCIAFSSTEANQNFQAWRAFDKNTTNNWASSVRTYDAEPWIQLTMPRALYNISIQITNDGVKGPTEGIIYGSNNNGVTLTQIGSFTGRSTADGASSTIQCNNTTKPYSTVRIKVVEHGATTDGYDNVDIGEISISGTDIGNNGGWANLENYKGINPVLFFPKNAMTSNLSMDCEASASSTFEPKYPAYQAFNRNYGDVWASNGSDAEPWIQLTMPIPLYNIMVYIINAANTKNPIEGIIYGSNDKGATLTQIRTFTNRPPISNSATCHLCNNTNTAYSTIRVQTTTKNASNIDIAEIIILGTKKP